MGALAPYLPEAVRAETVNQALLASWAIRSEISRIEVLGGLANYLPDSARTEALNQGLQIAFSGSMQYNAKLRAEALVHLAPHLPEAVFRAAQAMNVEGDRVRLLSALAPYLPEAVYQAAQAQAIADKGIQTWFYGRVALYLPEQQRIEAFDKALQSAQTIWDKNSRHLDLVSLVDSLMVLPKGELYSIWSNNLMNLKNLQRSESLFAISEYIPIIRLLGGDTALGQVFDAANAVNRWWP